MVPPAILTQTKLVSFTAVSPVSAVVPKINVTQPKHVYLVVTKSKSPIRWHITGNPSPKTNNSPPRVTAAKAPVVSAAQGMQGKWGNPQHAFKDKGVIDSGCSRHMIGNMSYLSDFEDLNGGYVTFGRNPKGGKISGKGKIKTGKLDFDDVYFVKELKFNLFSVSQMCDKKNSILFTETECLVLSPDFKLSDESQVPLRVPKENNAYNVNLKNIIPSGDLTCLFSKASLDESNLWHRRLGNIKFKTINKLVKYNLVRGLPIKVFENDNTCVACKKGKQHKASCKTKPVSSVDHPLYRLHTDLFGPTFVKILKKKSHCLVITDDYSRSDNGTEFKNTDLNQFCGIKGIKREFNSLLPILFWAEAVNIACYVQNRVLLTKPHNKTPYELLHGQTPSIGFMRPFGYPMTILNTLDSLGKFDEKVDERFLVGYSISIKAFRVFNSRNRIIQETLHVNFLENKPIVAEKAREENNQQYVLFLVWSSGFTNPQNNDRDAAFDGKEHDFNAKKPESEVNVSLSSCGQIRKQDDKTKKKAKGKISTVRQISPNNTNIFSVAGPSNVAASPTYGRSSFIDASQLPDDPDMPELEDIIYSDDDKDVGAEADFNNLETFITEEVYVYQLPGFKDPEHPDKVYKVVKALYGLHQAPRAWYETLENYLLKNGFKEDLCKAFAKLMKDKFQMSLMGEHTFFLGLQVKQKKDRIFISQVKYVAEILRKFGLNERKSASTPIDTEKPLLKDHDGEDMDVHTYRLMIGSLMYLTSSRPDIILAVRACARFQVTPKASHLHAVKKIFGYLKGKPHLGLWYSKCSPFDLVAYPDSDYAGASLDIKSTTRGCQSLGCRLISWQCKKQTVVATSSTEAEYVATASCYAQVLWIQNQLLDYRAYCCMFIDDKVAAIKSKFSVMDKDDAVVLMDEKEEEKKVEKAKIDESAQVQGRQAESQAEIYKIDMDHASKVLSMQEDELLGIKCSKAFPLLVNFATVSAKVFHY
nr:hypothetical protein [Tanacetum cinerariifolium]